MVTEQKVIEYPFELTEGGSSDDPVRVQIPLVRGIVQPLEVVFPPGPAGLVGVRAYQGSHQLVPQRDTKWLIGDGITYPHHTPINLLSPPYVITLEGYNEDETYEHTIIFRFTVTSPVEDPLVAIGELLRARLPSDSSPYIVAIPQMLAEITNTKLLLENYVVPMLDAMNKRDEDRWRSEIKGMSMEELARL